MNYSIGQVAEQLGVSVDTLRFYDKSGLLPFIKRTDSGRRIFSDQDIHLMRTIVCLKNAGVSVADISKFIKLRIQGNDTLVKRSELLKDHELNLQTQINDLQDTLSYLKYKEWYYETAVAAGDEAIHFVAGSDEVRPDLAQEYEQYLQASGQVSELARFMNVKDYRNKR